MAHKRADWLLHPWPPGHPQRFTQGDNIKSWANWLRHPHRLKGPHCSRAGDKIRNGSQEADWLYATLPSRGSPTLKSDEEYWKWPTTGQIGYATLTVLGVHNALAWRTKSAEAHKWADGLWPNHSGTQAGRQAGRQSGRQAGMRVETPCWVFFGVSLHLQTKKRLIAAATDNS